jgi:hypothetical protein
LDMTFRTGPPQIGAASGAGEVRDRRARGAGHHLLLSCVPASLGVVSYVLHRTDLPDFVTRRS